MNQTKKLLKNTLIYAIGNFGTKILSFLIVPLYTYFIGKEEMGVYDLLITTLTFTIPFITMQMTDGIYRWLMEKGSDKDAIIKSCFFLIRMTSGVAFLVSYFIMKTIHLQYRILFPLLLVTSVYYNVALQITRGLGNNKLYSTSGVINTAIFLSFNLYTVVRLKLGIRGLLISQILSGTLSFIILALRQKEFRRMQKKRTSWTLLRSMLIYSIPLIPNAISWSVIDVSDRYIITSFLGSGMNGLYAISAKFPSVVQMITSFFYLSWQDQTLGSDENADGVYAGQVFEAYYRFLFGFAICLIPITEFYIKVTMSSDYADAWIYTGMLYLGAVFSALASFLNAGYVVKKKSMRALYTTLVAAGTNIIINIALIKRYGLFAASASTLLSYMTLLGVRIFDTRKLLSLKTDWKKLFFVSIGSILFSAFYVCSGQILLYKILFQFLAFGLFVLWNKKILSYLIKKICWRFMK